MWSPSQIYRETLEARPTGPWITEQPLEGPLYWGLVESLRDPVLLL